MSTRVVDDFPTDLSPLNETRKCSVCGAYTWWAAPRQKTRGRCWDCVAELRNAPVTPAHEARILRLLVTTFPGSVLSRPTPVSYPPNVYVGRDAGPCVGCRRRVRRYGPDANPLCADCQARRAA